MNLLLLQEIRSIERVSAQCCCIPYIVIETFDCNCNDLELGRFKPSRSSRVKGHGAHWCFPIWPPLSPTSYLSPFSKYLTCNFNDLEQEGSWSFKVKSNGANRKRIGGFLSDLHYVIRRISSRIQIFDAKVLWPVQSFTCKNCSCAYELWPCTFCGI